MVTQVQSASSAGGHDDIYMRGFYANLWQPCKKLVAHCVNGKACHSYVEVTLLCNRPRTFVLLEEFIFCWERALHMSAYVEAVGWVLREEESEP